MDGPVEGDSAEDTGFRQIGFAREVSGTSLHEAQFDRPAFASNFGAHDMLEDSVGAGQRLMPKCIPLNNAKPCAHIASIRVADPFADGDEDRSV